MSMTEIDTFKALVEENGGDTEVLLIQFNNGYTKGFFHEEFSMDMYKPEYDAFKFYETDGHGKRYIIYKPLELIESVVFATDGNDPTTYDAIAVRN